MKILDVEEIKATDTETLVEKQDALIPRFVDVFGVPKAELMMLLEIERELTLRED